MKYFTKQQIEEIRKQLATLGVRDTDFETVTALRDTDFIAIVREGVNRKITPEVFCQAAAEYVTSVATVDSAYEIAVRNGFTGTEAEWLETLYRAQVIDSLTSTATNKALSANQGRALKALIDALPSYAVKTWANIQNMNTAPSDSATVLANARTAYELNRAKVTSVSATWPYLTLTTPGGELTANLSHTHSQYESAIADLQQAIADIPTGGSNVSLEDNYSYYDLTVGTLTVPIYSKRQVDGMQLTVADIPVGLGGQISASALRSALGITDSGSTANATLDNGPTYSTISVTVDGTITSAAFYTKAQVDELISQGGGGGGQGGGTTYKLTGDVDGGNGATIMQTTIHNGVVNANKLASNAVTTEKILNANVTEAKLANDAVTRNKIKNGEVLGAKLSTAARKMTLWGNEVYIGKNNNVEEQSPVVNGKLTFAAQTTTTAAGQPVLEVVNKTIGGETVPVLHSALPFYSDGFISASGLSSGSGGGGGSLPVDGVTAGQFLKYINTTLGWKSADITLPDIKATSSTAGQLGTDLITFMNRAIPSAQNNQVLKYNATTSTWELGTAALPEGTPGKILKYMASDGTTPAGWMAQDITLADIKNPSSYNVDGDDILYYDYTTGAWKNTSFFDYLTALTDAGMASSDKILKYDSSQQGWVLADVPSGGSSGGSVSAGNGISVSGSTVSVRLASAGGLGFNSSGALYVTSTPSSAGELQKLSDVDSSVQRLVDSGWILYYGGDGYWYPSKLKTINSESLLGSGDITISGGGSSSGIQSISVSQLVDSSSGTAIARIYVDGTPSTIYSPTLATLGISSSDISNWNSKGTGTITGVRLNGSTVAYSGVADLGNLVTPSSLTSTLSSYVTSSALQTELDDYLPLSAGSTKPLTGELYTERIIPTEGSTALREDGFDIGSGNSFFRDLYVRRIYFQKGSSDATSLYIEYDDDSGEIKLRGSLYATGGITAGA